MAHVAIVRRPVDPAVVVGRACVETDCAGLGIRNSLVGGRAVGAAPRGEARRRDERSPLRGAQVGGDVRVARLSSGVGVAEALVVLVGEIQRMTELVDRDLDREAVKRVNGDVVRAVPAASVLQMVDGDDRRVPGGNVRVEIQQELGLLAEREEPPHSPRAELGIEVRPGHLRRKRDEARRVVRAGERVVRTGLHGVDVEAIDVDPLPDGRVVIRSRRLESHEEVVGGGLEIGLLGGREPLGGDDEDEVIAVRSMVDDLRRAADRARRRHVSPSSARRGRARAGGLPRPATLAVRAGRAAPPVRRSRAPRQPEAPPGGRRRRRRSPGHTERSGCGPRARRPRFSAGPRLGASGGRGSRPRHREPPPRACPPAAACRDRRRAARASRAECAVRAGRRPGRIRTSGARTAAGPARPRADPRAWSAAETSSVRPLGSLAQSRRGDHAGGTGVKPAGSRTPRAGAESRVRQSGGGGAP